MLANVNDRYLVEYVRSIPGYHALRVLDYGCGDGEIVRALRELGVEAYGTEIANSYCHRDAANTDTAAKGWFRVFVPGEPLPFEDGSFDLIVSKMVFEHIPDKRAAFAELCRILHAEGRMYHQFPTLEVIREGHLGLPFVHRLRPGKVRHAAVMGAVSLGFGFRSDRRVKMSAREWTDHSLDYLDKYVYYEPYKAIMALFQEEFDVVHVEMDYARFRASPRPILSKLLAIQPLAPLYERVFRRLGFMAIELHRR